MLSGFNPQEIKSQEGAQQAIVALLNLVEEVRQENQELRAEVQRLRDEINRLKGEQGKPDIKANKREEKNHSSEAERRRPKSWRKSSTLPSKTAAATKSSRRLHFLTACSTTVDEKYLVENSFSTA